MCLLNLPDSMRKFGPSINLWEDSYQGESCLRMAKRHLKTGIRKNWIWNTLRNIMRDIAYQNVVGHVLDEEDILDNMNDY